MSIDEQAGRGGAPLETAENSDQYKRNKTKERGKDRPKVRKHLVTTAYKQDIAEKLDKLCAAGHTILAVTASTDVRGFEVVSYIEE